MNKEEYGDKFNEHLVEEYKLYVETADNVSNRRAQTNAFFISVLSALLVIPPLLNQGVLTANIQQITFIVVSLLGIFLCSTWYVNLQSFRRLNSAKYMVVHEIEQLLPFPCYAREWDILKPKKYVRLTRIEQLVPVFLACPFVIVLVYAITLH